MKLKKKEPSAWLGGPWGGSGLPLEHGPRFQVRPVHGFLGGSSLDSYKHGGRLPRRGHLCVLSAIEVPADWPGLAGPSGCSDPELLRRHPPPRTPAWRGQPIVSLWSRNSGAALPRECRSASSHALPRSTRPPGRKPRPCGNRRVDNAGPAPSRTPPPP